MVEEFKYTEYHDKYTGDLLTIPIRFDNNDVSGYERWNYRWWFAMAEFIDNSTHDYFQNRKALDVQLNSDGDSFEVRITVDRDNGQEVIEVWDNAGGMDADDLADAFDFGRRKKNPGRSAYGLGMKTAAIWMGRLFTIETSKLGVGKKITVQFDVNKVAEEGLRELDINEEDCDEDAHFTKIRVENLTKRLRGRTVSKVKDYLASIYRVDLREGHMKLFYNGDSISWDLYDDDSFMTAKDGSQYRQDFDFTTTSGKRVHGWFGIFARGKGGRTKAGFSTVQNWRVIQGYPNAWRPETCFGAEQAGTLVQQRLFGEFVFDGFMLSQTKDEILFDSDEELDSIEDALEEATREYRGVARKTHAELGLTGSGPSDAAVQDALDIIGEEVESQEAAEKVTLVPAVPPDVLEEQNSAIMERVQATTSPVSVYRIGETEVKIYFSDISGAEQYYVNDTPSPDNLIVVVNRAHPHWTMLSNHEVSTYLRHCIIDGLAEHRAQQLHGVTEVDETVVKKLKDELLRVRFEILQTLE